MPEFKIHQSKLNILLTNLDHNINRVFKIKRQLPDMTGSCQKTRAVARLEISYWQRQLPELKKKGADHFSRLSGILKL